MSYKKLPRGGGIDSARYETDHTWNTQIVTFDGIKRYQL